MFFSKPHASAALVAILLGPGCALFEDQPHVDTSTWLFVVPGDARAAKFNDMWHFPEYVPPVCPQGDDKLRDFTNKAPGKSNDQASNIRLCVDAFKQIIDLQWARYADSLWTANSAGNTALDISKLGLTGAATAVVGPSAQVLSGIATFIGGTQTTFNQDYLYNKSLELIVLQMQKDRATWADTIQKQLNANSYPNMYEAANDLYQYARAGSWTHAVISMQADSGAQTAACTKQVQATKQADAAAKVSANAAGGTAKASAAATPAPTATQPCAPSAAKPDAAAP